MAKIKSYTDLQQSKKLAKILPLESADMHYWLAWRGDVSKEVRNTPKVGTPNKDAIKTYWRPCWSLASLLGVIPKRIKEYNILRIDMCEKDFAIWYDEVGFGVNNNLPDITTDNPVDACVAMIEKLNELKML